MSEPKRRRRPQQPVQEAVEETHLPSAQKIGAAARRKRREEMRRQIRRERWSFALMVCCGAVALLSLTMIVKIVSRSIRTHVTNRQLSERREQLALQAAPTPEMLVFAPEPTLEAKQPTQPVSEPEATSPITTAPTATPKREIVRSTKYHIASGTPLAHMEALYEENRDLIGWLRMEEILDLPVMYKDNSYYLKRDFYKNKNEAGTLFLDENHRFSEKTQNLLLHGHNMKDGTMFGRLTQYLSDVSYLKNNPFVQFDTLWREEHYVIFAVLKVSLDVESDRFVNYFSYPTFASDAQFDLYIRQLQLRSEYAIPIEVEPGDALLTLSTCLENDRLVIVCRRLRENETRSQLRSAVRLSVRQ